MTLGCRISATLNPATSERLAAVARSERSRLPEEPGRRRQSVTMRNDISRKFFFEIAQHHRAIRPRYGSPYHKVDDSPDERVPRVWELIHDRRSRGSRFSTMARKARFESLSAVTPRAVSV